MRTDRNPEDLNQSWRYKNYRGDWLNRAHDFYDTVYELFSPTSIRTFFIYIDEHFNYQDRTPSKISAANKLVRQTEHLQHRNGTQCVTQNTPCTNSILISNASVLVQFELP